MLEPLPLIVPDKAFQLYLSVSLLVSDAIHVIVDEAPIFIFLGIAVILLITGILLIALTTAIVSVAVT